MAERIRRHEQGSCVSVPFFSEIPYNYVRCSQRGLLSSCPRRIITENQNLKNRVHPRMKAVQTVIDEKQARIDELEQQIATMMMSKTKK